MEYRKYGTTYYLRMDRGDEIIGGILDVCKCEGIRSAVYSGIGGCSEAEIELRPVLEGLITRKFDPETGTGFWKFN